MKIPDNTREEFYNDDNEDNDSTCYYHVYDRDAVTGEHIQSEETPSVTFANTYTEPTDPIYTGPEYSLSNQEASTEYEEAIESMIAANPNYWQEAHGEISNTAWSEQDEEFYQEIRQGLTIHPADEPGRQRISWGVIERIGDVIVNNSAISSSSRRSISVGEIGEMLNPTRRPMSCFIIPKKSKTEKILMEIIRKGLEKHGDGWTLDDGLTLSQEEKETIVAIENEIRNEIRNERGKPGVNLEKQP